MYANIDITVEDVLRIIQDRDDLTPSEFEMVFDTFRTVILKNTSIEIDKLDRILYSLVKTVKETKEGKELWANIG